MIQLTQCEIFANLYSLLIDHILREARFYLKSLRDIQNRIKPSNDIIDQEIFWDTIMKEHALFIRGLLDPVEIELFNTANNFGKIFDDLIEKTEKTKPEDILKITEEP